LKLWKLRFVTDFTSDIDTASANVVASEERSFDAKRDLGRSLVRKLKRARVQLVAARKLKIPARQVFADKLWNQCLSSTSFPSIDAVPAIISGSGTAVCNSWWELKYWTFIASCFEQHRVYEGLLAEYDTVRPFVSSQPGGEVWFFGSGHGRSTLNTYRCIRGAKGAVWQFEKVYNRSDEDFCRMLSMESCAGDQLRARGVFVPPLLDTKLGSRVGLSYSTFAKGRRLNASREFERGNKVVKALMASPIDESRLSSVVRCYHPNFLEALSKARNWIRRKKPELSSAFEEVAVTIDQHYPRYLAHGDLHRKNMLTSGAVLDWDNSGFYPVGYDPGMMIARSLGQRHIDEVEQALRQYFSSGISDVPSTYLSHGSLFYAFVFGAGKTPFARDSLLVAMLEKIVKQAESGRP
jgi:hypothetical protein